MQYISTLAQVYERLPDHLLYSKKNESAIYSINIVNVDKHTSIFKGNKIKNKLEHDFCTLLPNRRY